MSNHNNNNNNDNSNNNNAKNSPRAGMTGLAGHEIGSGVVEAVVVDATPVMVPLVSTWSGMIPYGSGQSEEDTS